MKIRKFNEARENIDSEYVSHCFADLLDAGAELTESNFISAEGDSFLYVEIKFDITDSNGDVRIKLGGVKKEFISRRNKLTDYINDHNYNNILLQKVQIGFTLLSDEYPNYKVYSQMTNTRLIINIYPF
jgi:hypothetical protein